MVTESVFFALAAAGVTAIIGLIVRAARAATLRRLGGVLDRAARSLGLIHRPGIFPSHHGLLEGKIDGHTVLLTMTRRKGKTLTRMTVAGADPAVSLRRETVALKLGMTFERWLAGGSESPWERAGDILIGDETFDNRIDMRGPIPFCVSALDQSGRDAVLSVVDDWGGRVRRGEVAVETERDLTRPGDLEELIRSAHRLAKLLRHCTTKQIKKRLIANFHGEKDPHVRKTILAALGMGFTGDPDTLAVSREALADTSYNWIPVQAAANLSEEGIPTLRAILNDHHQDELIHARCVRLMAEALPEGEAEMFLLAQLVDPRSAVAFAAAESLGAQVGSAKAVPLLTEIADHHDSDAVRRAAQKALDAIAIKLEGVEPGGLALAQPEEDGQLSRAEEAGPVPHPGAKVRQ